MRRSNDDLYRLLNKAETALEEERRTVMRLLTRVAELEAEITKLKAENHELLMQLPED